jgi:hypothetical protein
MSLNRVVFLTTLLLVPTASAGCGSSGSKHRPSTTGAATAPIRPSDFSARVDNPYFPLRAGTTLRYRGNKDGKPSIDVVTVTRETARIMGVPCVTVHDSLYQSGRLAEQTTDWYTQDKHGNVWYFGEATRELDAKGRTTSTEGSWKAGVDGALPGIFMPPVPRLGDSFRQEYYKGHAEDHFKVLDLHASVTVPFASYTGNALRTEETTPLEPDVLDNKYYVRGIGEVKEVTVKGGRELFELVSVTRG